MDKKQRDIVLRAIRNIDGATQRQIARITGINQSTISQA
jgi:putative transposase